MNIYQIKITLDHVKPAIWRRMLVAGDTKLGKLHDIVQAVMGWDDCHLHEFIIGHDHYGTPDADAPQDLKSEHRITLEKIVNQGDKFIYEYDFGDGWRHTLKIEKVLPAEKDQRYPRCLAGECACPPEDSGGIPGYMRMLEILNNPSGEEYDEMLEWTGEDFDPEAFDLDAINQALWRLR